VVADPPRTRPPLHPATVASLCGTDPEPEPFVPTGSQVHKERA